MALSAKITGASISASTSSARTAYPAVNDNKCLWRVYNPTTAVAFVRSGDSSVAATTTDRMIGAGSTIVIIRDPVDTNLAAILSASTGTIYFEPTDSYSSTVT